MCRISEANDACPIIQEETASRVDELRSYRTNISLMHDCTFPLRRATGIACLLVFGAAAGVSGQIVETSPPRPSPTALTPPAEIERVNASRIHVHFRLKPGSKPRAVQVYFTNDGARSWHAARSAPAESPAVFDAPADGDFGLYLAFASAEGSARQPAPGKAPHRWVRVDRTPPVVQLLSLKPDHRFGSNREIQLRWRVEDDDLPGRPVAIHYRSEQTKSFVLVADSLGGDGAYRWTVPVGISGRVELRWTAVDRAGNRGEYCDERLHISGEAAELAFSKTLNEADGLTNRTSIPSTGKGVVENSQGSGADVELAGVSEPDGGEQTGQSVDASQAKKQYDLGAWHRLRGEFDLAVLRYRDALRLRPDFRAARIDLAAVLCVRGEWDEAEREYATVLDKDTKDRSALKGLALIQGKKRNYRSAHATLQKLLLLDPKDAESWLYFGDVCLFLGERPAAREAWLSAGTLAASPKEVRARAVKRLEIYSSESLMLARESSDE